MASEFQGHHPRTTHTATIHWRRRQTKTDWVSKVSNIATNPRARYARNTPTVCVCVQERERERGTKRERENIKRVLFLCQNFSSPGNGLLRKQRRLSGTSTLECLILLFASLIVPVCAPERRALGHCLREHDKKEGKVEETRDRSWDQHIVQAASWVFSSVFLLSVDFCLVFVVVTDDRYLTIRSGRRMFTIHTHKPALLTNAVGFFSMQGNVLSCQVADRFCCSMVGWNSLNSACF